MDQEIPDNIDEDEDDALVGLFSQQTQAPTSLERATIYKNNFVDCHRKACCVWRGYAAATNTKAVFDKMAADLNKIAIPGMII